MSFIVLLLHTYVSWYATHDIELHVAFV